MSEKRKLRSSKENAVNQTKKAAKPKDSCSKKPSKNYHGDAPTGQEIWDVEKVVDKKIEPNGRELYLVKWKGWPKSDSTWEPRESFDCDPETLLSKTSATNTPAQTNLSSDPDVTTIRIKLNSSMKNSPTKSERSDTMSRQSEKSSIAKSLSQKSKISKTEKSDIDVALPQLESEQLIPEEWKRNEVRIAVQSQAMHAPQMQEVVIPSDLDTEYYMKSLGSDVSNKTISDGLAKTTSGDFSIPKDSPGFISNFRSGMLSSYEEDGDYLRMQSADNESLMFPKDNQGSNEFDFIKDSLYPSNIAQEDRLLNQSAKKVCKSKYSDVYQYTITNQDQQKKFFEVSCSEKTKNKHLYTKWLDIAQAKSICPQETIDYLLMITGLKGSPYKD